MVLAWLASSRAEHRYTEKGAMPFVGENQTHRRRQRLGVQASTGGAPGEAVARQCLHDLGNNPAEIVETPDPLSDGCISALASLVPSFQYDDTKLLDATDRLQYEHWVRSGVDPSDLCFFTLAAVAPLPQHTPARVYGSRTVSKTFLWFEDAAAEAMLCDLGLGLLELEWIPPPRFLDPCCVCV